jgi:hypothetical protein
MEQKKESGSSEKFPAKEIKIGSRFRDAKMETVFLIKY